jgi:glycerol-3-phosphate acyltransferase PlsX
MRIVLDAMGSDNAPFPEVRGAVEASLSSDAQILLVGDQERLTSALAAYPKRGQIEVVHASQSITMNDSPVLAVRQKKDSSLSVGLRLIKEGRGDGFLSAGNTGAVMVAARTILGPVPGVARSAICQMLPTRKDPVVILDLGANVDCSARHLCEFAEMGMVYSKFTLGVKNPRVGLLNIGEEQAKGNEMAKSVHRSLTEAKQINFIGNVEPKAVFSGDVDVVVCDGFVGNVILKTSEAVASLMTTLVRRELESTWVAMVGALLSRGAFKRLKNTIDPNAHPGAPLLGINGVLTILHGSSSHKGIANGIKGTAHLVSTGLITHIRESVAELRAAEARLIREDSTRDQQETNP